MRVAVLVLVLADFAVFAWLHWARPFAPPPDTGLAPPATAGVPLKLIAGAAPKPARCLVVGPAPDRTAARALADRLRQQGYPARPVARRPATPDRYQVVLAGFGNAAAARAAASRLRAGGIDDLLLGDVGGASAHGISLGLFSDLAHARRRAARVRALGFKPAIRGRYAAGGSWSVEVAAPADATALAAAAATVVRTAACEAAAPASG